MRLTALFLTAAMASLPAVALAQAADPHAGHAMGAEAAEPAAEPASDPHAGHTMPASDPHAGHTMPAAEETFEEAEAVAADDMGGSLPLSYGSGTARLPASEAMHGFHLPVTDSSMVMLHGYAWGVYTRQTGPRGDDKFYVQSMLMGSYEKRFSGGKFMLRTMLSLEPAMDRNGYPVLFGSGETAYGEPLVDRQHPHDLFMELAGRVDIDLKEGTSLFVYGGPVGEPALGPSAFIHRQSAYYNPEAPITHHWFDSTHITYGVVTAGIAAPTWQLEVSAFRGQEPDERRWNIESPRLDSWSLRGSFAPTGTLLLQASYGEMKEPEALHPGEDEHRFTASAHYNSGKGLAAMVAYSAKKRVPGETLPAFLAEANWDLDRRNTVFGRFENVVNDELFPDHDDPLHEQRFRISKFQVGYAHRLPVGPFELSFGGTLAAFAKPDILDPFYGSSPVGYTLFARLALGG